MNAVVSAMLIALAVGAGGTGGGALLSCAIKTTGQKLNAALMGLSSGIVIAMVFFDMLPEAWEMAGPTSLIGVAIGIAVLFLLIRLVPHKDAAEFDEQTVSDIRESRLARTGLLIAVGVAIHNLPQGIAIGSGIVSGQNFGLVLSLLLLLHNIPEGMIMAIPLKIGKVPFSKIILLAVLAALPTVAGALVGGLIANISEAFIGAAVGFAAGSMGLLIFTEMLPQAFSLHKGVSTIATLLAGVALGIGIVCLVG